MPLHQGRTNQEVPHHQPMTHGNPSAKLSTNEKPPLNQPMREELENHTWFYSNQWVEAHGINLNQWEAS